MNRTLTQPGEAITDRTLKLVRLRVGVFGDGAAVGERQQPSRSVHVVDISADLNALEGVTVCCGAHFAPGTLVEVPWMAMEPHRVCRQRSSMPAGVRQPRIGSGAKAEVVMDDAHNDDSVSEESGVCIQVTAQWSVTDPVIYVNHVAGSDFVDLAISGSGDNDVIARFQIRDPLDVLRAGHNLIRAGLSLAEARGVDIVQLKAVNPSVWWSQIPFTTTGESASDEESPSP